MKHASFLLRALPAVLLAGSILGSCGRSDDGPPATSDARGSASVGDIAGGDTAAARPDSVAAPSATGTTSDPGHKYRLKSGIIHYSNSVLGREQVFYFDDYGKKEALYDVVPTGAAEGAETESPYVAIIQVDGNRHMFDLKSRRGSKRRVGEEPGAILGTIPDVWKAIPISRDARKADDLPPRDVLGRKTDGYGFQETGQAGSYKVWIWNQIPLYAEIRLTETPLIFEAVSIEENVPIPAGTFTPPRDVILALE